jgi:hypothetical protein
VLGEELQELSKLNEDKVAMAQITVLPIFSQCICHPLIYHAGFVGRMPRDAVMEQSFI